MAQHPNEEEQIAIVIKNLLPVYICRMLKNYYPSLKHFFFLGIKLKIPLIMK